MAKKEKQVKEEQMEVDEFIPITEVNTEEVKIELKTIKNTVLFNVQKIINTSFFQSKPKKKKKKREKQMEEVV